MRRVFLAGLAGLAAAAVSAPLRADNGARGANYFPNLPVVTQDGKTVNFYDDLIKGKVVVISFIYTSCADPCPLTTARLTEVKDKLGDAVGRDVFMYSLTVDPEHDTPEKMKSFADAFNAGPGWQFLTGKPEDMKAITGKLGDRSRILSEHRNEIVLGNDATGEWQRDSALGDIDRLVMNIRSLDPKWRDQVRVQAFTKALDGGSELSKEPGQALFKKICAGCHTIGVGDRVGPDLRSLTDRRDRAWIMSFIESPAKMRAKKDPIALELKAKYPGVRMPALGLTANDAADFIAYIEGQTSKLGDTAQNTPAPGEHEHHR
jgi:protein SCO1